MSAGAAPFVHLHLHTQYSLLDGAIRIKELMQKAVGLGMPAVAMTDHGNLFGAIEFYQAAKAAGINPIIGCEMYIAPGSMRDKKASSAKDASNHFTLLAKNAAGYKNLVKLVTAGYLDGYYYKPRIDKDLLARHAEGLIALSGCLKGELNGHLLADQPAKARQAAATYRDIFAPGDFYIELHDHGLNAQAKCNPGLIAIAREFGLPLVAANDVHFLERSQHDAHDVMICIGTGAMVHDEKRMRYPAELYFKTPDEMSALFSEVPEAISNTLRIAEKCNLELEFGVSKYPAYEPPAGKSRTDYLRELSEAGLRRRYGERADSDPELRRRMDYELSVLDKAGFNSYFLIVWDFINYARTRGIPVGPGRGSAAGSLVAYVLGITDLDPLRFGLIFERFLNPERVSPPDIDIDFCMARRGEVIDYVRRKYGERAVSQIVTFGSLSSKAVLRDVSRVLGMSYTDGDRLSKMIPLEGAKPLMLAAAAEKNPDLKHAIETEPGTRQVWDYALVLEGLTRGTGVHAAGVVIGDRDLDEYIPLARDKEEQVITQYAGGPLNDLGLLKMDFLGLKTLTVIEDTLTLIRPNVPGFDLEAIAFDEPRTISLLNRGETVGVFQLESGGMTSVCKQFDIQSIDDLIAISALYRPGPMEMIPDYIRRKKGETKIKYEHPLLKDVCGDTYGIMIYQEQVQRAANVLAGYTLGQADLLRRAMGKKDKEKMAKERDRFIAGCERVNGIAAAKANTIFDLLEKFAGYGFNKSHSAAYGLITYRTAYLKANYPVEFMSALLSNAINDTDKIAVLVAELQRMGIPIYPPDVNKSQLKFAPEKVVSAPQNGDAASLQAPVTFGIRFGLAAIKNVGEAAMASVVEEREKNGEFKSLEDFCGRLDGRAVNRKILESLIRSGAMDFTGRDRAEMFERIDTVLASAVSSHRDRAQGQASMFDDFLTPSAAPENGAAGLAIQWKPWSNTEKLAHEKELLGFYVTGHPLNPYRSALTGSKYTPVSGLGVLEDRANFMAAGALIDVAKKFTRKDGKPFAVIMLEDLSGTMEAMVWNDVYTKSAHLLEPGKIVAVSARVDKRGEELRVVINDVKALKPKADAPVNGGPLRLRLELGTLRSQDLEELRDILGASPGEQPVELEFSDSGGRRMVIEAGASHRVRLTPELQARLGSRFPV
jgi:DNA polymerase-3 subunit alpha